MNQHGIHLPDNGDGTFTNPVRPDAHWSDPSLLPWGDAWYCSVSGADACPIGQILRSYDLVNWEVVSSLSRFWPEGLPRVMAWSSRISRCGDKVRAMGHITHEHVVVFEADSPEGPWRRIEHRFKDMAWQWAPTLYTEDDGSLWLYANNWIQRVTPDGLELVGERFVTVTGHNPENAYLVKRDGWYWWFQSLNNCDWMGVGTDAAKLAVWRSRTLTGPFEGPVDLICGNNRWQCPNSASLTQAPDGRWWIAYNTFDSLRMVMCRQMHLDPLDWEPGQWPTVNGGSGPGTTHPKPVAIPGTTALPQPNDGFDGPGLAGVTSGALGSKWLFRDERPNAWSLDANPGWLRLNTLYPSIERQDVANFLGQRPLGGYYTATVKLRFRPNSIFQQAGLMVREPCSGNGVAIGVQCPWFSKDRYALQIKTWFGHQGKLMQERELVATLSGDGAPQDLWLRIEMHGFAGRCLFSTDGTTWTRASTAWGWDWMMEFNWNRYWATFMPGVFAGSTFDTPKPGHADFDDFTIVVHDR